MQPSDVPDLLIEPESPYWDYAKALVGVTEIVTADLILEGIQEQLVPMAVPTEFLAIPRDLMGWWRPDPRGVLPPDEIKVSRSLRKSCQAFNFEVDTEFALVVEGRRQQVRDDAWLNDSIADIYLELHSRQVAHSVEIFDEEGNLVGGLFGLSIGSYFSGESMFFRRSDASKAALVALTKKLQRDGFTVLDLQWLTPHLASLGGKEIPASAFAEHARSALTQSHRWTAEPAGTGSFDFLVAAR